MKSSKIELFLVLTILLILNLNCVPKLVVNQSLKEKIEWSLLSKNDTFKIDEEIVLYLTITNNSDKDIYIYNTKGYFVNGKPIGEYDITVLDNNNVKIKPKNIFDNISVSSRSDGFSRIQPKKSLEIRFNIQKYADFTDTGKYKITVQKGIYIYYNKRNKHRKYEYQKYKNRIEFKGIAGCVIDVI